MREINAVDGEGGEVEGEEEARDVMTSGYTRPSGVQSLTVMECR